jgi:3-deoxy-alpha-D-manno-octulosonate 8-oxidase
MKNSINVARYILGNGAIKELANLLQPKRQGGGKVIFCLDYFFKTSPLVDTLPIQADDAVIFIDSSSEPKTTYIDSLVVPLTQDTYSAVVGIGSGCTLDISKAISNLLGNGGRAADYQGWDLLKKPGVYKIGIPTLSGTGAETSRTCVMTNPETHLKLGMNSDYTMFDQLILDPDLTKTAPRQQYFYTGMDAYMHAMEMLNGRFRNALSDAFAAQAITLCEQVFLSDDMQDDVNREKLMAASYLGGSAIANSMVGLVHPLSAGLSVVLGTPHALSNCLVLNVLEKFYPKEFCNLQKFLTKQKINLPIGLTKNLSEDDFNRLYDASIVHEKPLTNALGPEFRNVMTPEKVRSIYEKI